MATTYQLIASATATGSETTISFTSIPQTYTDLVLRVSYRGSNASAWAGNLTIRPNAASGTNNTYLSGTGAAATSYRVGQWYALIDSTSTFTANSNGNTSNTFSNIEYYIPSYTVSQARQVSGFAVGEQNATTAYMSVTANYYSSTTAITQLDVRDLNYMGAGSTFFLYGIKNS